MAVIQNEIHLNRIFKYDIVTYHKLGAAGILPRNTELIHGVVVYKMTISPIHRKAVHKLREILSSIFQNQYILFQESPITIQDSEPEPYLLVLEGSHDDFSDKHPQTAKLVIEISVSSLEDDLQKANLYALAKIPFYWILNIQDKKVEVFSEPSPSGYITQKTYSYEEKISVPFSDQKISLSEIV